MLSLKLSCMACPMRFEVKPAPQAEQDIACAGIYVVSKFISVVDRLPYAESLTMVMGCVQAGVCPFMEELSLSKSALYRDRMTILWYGKFCFII